MKKNKKKPYKFDFYIKEELKEINIPELLNQNLLLNQTFNSVYFRPKPSNKYMKSQKQFYGKVAYKKYYHHYYIYFSNFGDYGVHSYILLIKENKIIGDLKNLENSPILQIDLSRRNIRLDTEKGSVMIARPKYCIKYHI